MIIFRYRWHTGSLAWIIHRLTGIGLTLYIFLHLYVLSNLREPERFDAVMALMSNPLARAGEAALIGLVAAHALNGVRLTLIDLGMSSRGHKPAFRVAAALCLAVTAIGAVVFMGGAH